MTNPISLSQLTRVQPNFNTVNSQNEALVKSTGLTIHELMAEAVAHERQKMILTGESKEYIKLLVTIFGKFSVGAPQHVITEESSKPMSREEIKGKIDNYLTRIALTKKTETPEPNEDQ